MERQTTKVKDRSGGLAQGTRPAFVRLNGRRLVLGSTFAPCWTCPRVAETIEDFAYLWTAEREDWVVLRPNPAETGLPYYGVSHQMLLIDENDELGAAVIQRVIDEGVPIVSHPE